MKNTFDIVILQTNREGFLTAELVVSELHLEGRVYVIGTFNQEKIISLLELSTEQLFITGTLNGYTTPIIEFVGELRKMFPHLTCVSYARVPMPMPPFH